MKFCLCGYAGQIVVGRGPRGPCGLKSKYPDITIRCYMSRPARALWIEIIIIRNNLNNCKGRGPRGPCGLKSVMAGYHRPDCQSRPARALWIEICIASLSSLTPSGRGPRGPCGLKSDVLFCRPFLQPRRGPRGPCGLKSAMGPSLNAVTASRPARALWIEILQVIRIGGVQDVEAREGLVD